MSCVAVTSSCPQKKRPRSKAAPLFTASAVPNPKSTKPPARNLGRPSLMKASGRRMAAVYAQASRLAPPLGRRPLRGGAGAPVAGAARGRRSRGAGRAAPAPAPSHYATHGTRRLHSRRAASISARVERRGPSHRNRRLVADLLLNRGNARRARNSVQLLARNRGRVRVHDLPVDRRRAVPAGDLPVEQDPEPALVGGGAREGGPAPLTPGALTSRPRRPRARRHRRGAWGCRCSCRHPHGS